jgi:hypothetical protein
MNLDLKLWWYVARAGGLVAWWLVAASVFWGLLLSTKVLQRKPPPAWLLDLHRFLGGLSIVFTAVHMVALIADSYVPFTPTDLLVPMAADWRPGPLAWGVVSLYLMVSVQLTSLFMRRIPRAWWRRIHATSFILFIASTVHALTAGSDSGNAAVQWSALLMATVFVFLVTYRQAAGTSRRRSTRGRGPTSSPRRPAPTAPPPPTGTAATDASSPPDRQEAHPATSTP